MKTMKFHEASNIFTLLEGEAYEKFKADIVENGIAVPIVTLDGEVLDGRNRYRVAEEAGVELPQCEWKGECGDPVRFVISTNLHRRQLTESQRAMVAARMREYFDKEAKKRMEEGRKKGGGTAGRGRPKGENSSPANLPETKTGRDARDDAGAAVNVGGRTVDYATKVLRDGIEGLAESVDHGKMAVSVASSVADLPNAKQRQAIEAAEAGNKKQVRELCNKARKTKARKEKPKKEDQELVDSILDNINELIKRAKVHTHGLQCQRDAFINDLRVCRTHVKRSSRYLL